MTGTLALVPTPNKDPNAQPPEGPGVELPGGRRSRCRATRMRSASYAGPWARGWCLTCT